MAFAVTRVQPPAPTTDRRRLGGRWLALMGALVLFAVSVSLVTGSLREVGTLRDAVFWELWASPLLGMGTGALLAIALGSSTAGMCLVVAALASGTIGVEKGLWLCIGTGLETMWPGLVAALQLPGHARGRHAALSTACIHALQQLLGLMLLVPLEIVLHPLRTCATAVAAALHFLGRTTGSAPVTVPRPTELVAHSTGAAAPDGPLAVLGIVVGVVLCAVTVRIVGHLLHVLLVGRSRSLLLRAVRARPAAAVAHGAALGALAPSPGHTIATLVRFSGIGAIDPDDSWWATMGAGLGAFPLVLASAAIAAGPGSGQASGVVVACALYCVAAIALFAVIGPLRLVVTRGASALTNWATEADATAHPAAD